MSKKNKKMPPKLSYEEMKQYLEFLDECMWHLVENRIIFRDFYSALIQQKADMNPFISWSLNNYKNIFPNSLPLIKPHHNKASQLFVCL